MKFITYNDSPGGVYKSQVTDVCRFLQSTFKIEIELIAFVSLRTFLRDRREIKKLYTNSIVLPSFPGIENWKKNLGILKLFMFFKKPDTAIARGVFATLLALNCKKITSVCFDSRTAYAAEWKEYLYTESPSVATDMSKLEKEALSKSNFKIAVSEKLVSYWKENYSYNKNNHVVIPCTIDSSLDPANVLQHTPDSIEELRLQLGIANSDVLLVFAGSTAGWQSVSGLYRILKTAFIENTSIKLLFLSKEAAKSELSKAFPGRVITTWVQPEKVLHYLKAADYGLLYREESVTNRVSAPVKFGEYLLAGLPVIISNNVGDYSAFVKEKNCGLQFDYNQWSGLKRPSFEDKIRIQGIAFSYFTKSAFKPMYEKVIEMK